MARPYDIGDTAMIEATFRDQVSGALIDPDTVTAIVERPDGTLVDPAPVTESPSSGIYRAFVSIDTPGQWLWTIVGSDADIKRSGVVQGEFDAVPTRARYIISLNELKTALNKPDTDVANDDSYRQAIRAADQAIRTYTDRDFGTPLSVETRNYRYDGNGVLEIDDVQAGTLDTVTVDDVELTVDQYVPQPFDGPTYTWLELPGHTWGSPEMGFERNLDRWWARHRGLVHAIVGVTGGFGWVTVPEDVKRAAVWTAAAFLADPRPFTSESISDYSYTIQTPISEPIPERAKPLLDPYVRLKI